MMSQGHKVRLMTTSEEEFVPSIETGKRGLNGHGGARKTKTTAHAFSVLLLAQVLPGALS